MDDDHTINGKRLADCSDAELRAEAHHVAVQAEMRLREHARRNKPGAKNWSWSDEDWRRQHGDH